MQGKSPPVAMATGGVNGPIFCVIWEWRRDDGSYSPYYPQSSQLIEEAYAANLTQYDYQLPDSDNNYAISFNNMVQTSLHTGAKRHIRRTLLQLPSSPDISGYWLWEEAHDRFVPFSIPASVDIELAHMTQPACRSVDLSKCPCGIPYTVDFVSRVQVRHVFDTERRVHREQLAYPLQSYLKVRAAYTVAMPTTSAASSHQGGKGKSLFAVPAVTTSQATATVTAPAGHMTKPLSTSVHSGASRPTNASAAKLKQTKKAAQGKSGITRTPLPGSYAVAVASLKPGEDESCPVCLNQLSEPSDFDEGSPPVPTIPLARPIDVCRLKKCKHMLHRSCLLNVKSHAKDGFQCPLCKTMYGTRTGDMPDGRMTVTKHSYSLPGYEGYGTYEITYDFEAGVHNGRRYWTTGFPRKCYLPQCPQGSKVLELLKVAWDRRLTFTIGTSVTTGSPDTVVWNEIHHKTSITNHSGHGYPDPNYLDNVMAELASQGVTPAGDSGTEGSSDGDDDL